MADASAALALPSPEKMAREPRGMPVQELALNFAEERCADTY
jgi:hypothetical protein